MEMAAVLAAGLRDWIDFGVIIGILLLNATVGWYQEKQAADIVTTLKGDIAMKALAVRDGQEREIQARELVPGDIVCIPRHANHLSTHQGQVILEEGSTVPGEVRLICAYDDADGFEKFNKLQSSFANNLSTERVDEGASEEKESAWGSSIVAVDQSAMTGESLAVNRFGAGQLTAYYQY
jgi:H+-transporting ATPase